MRNYVSFLVAVCLVAPTISSTVSATTFYHLLKYKEWEKYVMVFIYVQFQRHLSKLGGGAWKSSTGMYMNVCPNSGFSIQWSYTRCKDFRRTRDSSKSLCSNSTFCKLWSISMYENTQQTDFFIIPFICYGTLLISIHVHVCHSQSSSQFVLKKTPVKSG